MPLDLTIFIMATLNFQQVFHSIICIWLKWLNSAGHFVKGVVIWRICFLFALFWNFDKILRCQFYVIFEIKVYIIVLHNVLLDGLLGALASLTCRLGCHSITFIRAIILTLILILLSTKVPLIFTLRPARVDSLFLGHCAISRRIQRILQLQIMTLINVFNTLHRVLHAALMYTLVHLLAHLICVGLDALARVMQVGVSLESFIRNSIQFVIKYLLIDIL